MLTSVYGTNKKDMKAQTELIRKRLMGLIYDHKKLSSTVDGLVADVVDLQLDPYTAADRIFSRILK